MEYQNTSESELLVLSLLSMSSPLDCFVAVLPADLFDLLSASSFSLTHTSSSSWFCCILASGLDELDAPSKFSDSQAMPTPSVADSLTIHVCTCVHVSQKEKGSSVLVMDHVYVIGQTDIQVKMILT